MCDSLLIKFDDFPFFYRTVLQTEPVLGGKRLDLLKIYKTVIEAGGYEKVNNNYNDSPLFKLFFFFGIRLH